MKIIITLPGARSAGPTAETIELNYKDRDLPDDNVEREDLRADIYHAFAMLENSVRQVRFEDECSFCLTRLGLKKKCPDKKCPTHLA